MDVTPGQPPLLCLPPAACKPSHSGPLRFIDPESRETLTSSVLGKHSLRTSMQEDEASCVNLCENTSSLSVPPKLKPNLPFSEPLRFRLPGHTPGKHRPLNSFNISSAQNELSSLSVPAKLKSFLIPKNKTLKFVHNRNEDSSLSTKLTASLSDKFDHSYGHFGPVDHNCISKTFCYDLHSSVNPGVSEHDPQYTDYEITSEKGEGCAYEVKAGKGDCIDYDGEYCPRIEHISGPSDLTNYFLSKALEPKYFPTFSKPICNIEPGSVTHVKENPICSTQDGSISSTTPPGNILCGIQSSVASIDDINEVIEDKSKIDSVFLDQKPCEGITENDNGQQKASESPTTNVSVLPPVHYILSRKETETLNPVNSFGIVFKKLPLKRKASDSSYGDLVRERKRLSLDFNLVNISIGENNLISQIENDSSSMGINLDQSLNPSNSTNLDMSNVENRTMNQALENLCGKQYLEGNDKLRSFSTDSEPLVLHGHIFDSDTEDGFAFGEYQKMAVAPLQQESDTDSMGEMSDDLEILDSAASPNNEDSLDANHNIKTKMRDGIERKLRENKLTEKDDLYCSTSAESSRFRQRHYKKDNKSSHMKSRFSHRSTSTRMAVITPPIRRVSSRVKRQVDISDSYIWELAKWKIKKTSVDKNTFINTEKQAGVQGSKSASLTNKTVKIITRSSTLKQIPSKEAKGKAKHSKVKGVVSIKQDKTSTKRKLLTKKNGTHINKTIKLIKKKLKPSNKNLTKRATSKTPKSDKSKETQSVKGPPSSKPGSLFALSELDHAWNSILPVSDLLHFEKQLHEKSEGSKVKSGSGGLSSLFNVKSHPGGIWQSIFEED